MRSRLATTVAAIWLFVPVALCVRPQAAGSSDDSVWINQGISAALAQGASSYTLPAGTYNIQNPIVIPAGAQNFSLVGAGSSKTILTTPSGALSQQVIQVGVNPVLSDNWWITGSNNVPINSVVTGQSSIKLVTPSASFKTGYYILWDAYKVMCAKGPNDSMNHAEVVKVTAYNPTTGVATIDVPAGREYTQSPMLAPYQGAVCTNITVSGIGFNGYTSNGYTEGLLMVGISDHVAVNDLNVINFNSDAIMTNTARYVTISNSNVSTTDDGDAGSGYGFAIYRSRFVTVQNCTANQCRHGFIIHSGSMDVTLSQDTTYNGIDTHGYDERRICIFECTGDGGDIGNDAWLAGANGVLIQNCNFNSTFGFHANVRNVRVVNTTLAGVGMYSVDPGTTPTVGVPAGGMADAIMFVHCNIVGGGFTLFSEEGATRMGAITFSQCNFENTGTDWGTDIDLAAIPGNLNLLSCTLKVDSADHVVQLTDPANLVFVMRQCQLIGQGNLGVWVSSAFGGRAQFVGNNYTSLAGSSASFLCDDTKKQISINNSATLE
jgi:hypothetical protein